MLVYLSNARAKAKGSCIGTAGKKTRIPLEFPRQEEKRRDTDEAPAWALP